MVECVWPFCGIGASDINTGINSSVDFPILNESTECMNEPSTESLPVPVSATSESE